MSDVRQEIRSHRDLIVWQKAMDLVTSVYRLTEDFPKSELYGLTSQIRRCATSIPANIAEGQGRRLGGEFLQFLGNARGSLLELDTHLEIAVRLGMVNKESHSSFMEQLIEVRKLLNGLMRSIKPA
jgi:four helix bundle protein